MSIRLYAKDAAGVTVRHDLEDEAALVRLVERYGDQVVSVEISGRCNTPLPEWTQGIQIVWAGGGRKRAWGSRGYVHFVCKGRSLPEVLAARDLLRDELIEG
jgi:hypothetical protein